MKKKILFIHHAGGFGGAPKSMSYVIKNIDKSKFEPMLINIEAGPINDFFKKLPIELRLVNGIRPFHGSTVVEKKLILFIRNWFFLIPSIIKAFKLIKEYKPDLVHLNSTCLFAFAIAAKFLNIKVICHVREPLRKGFWGFPIRFFSKRSVDGFIAICQNDLNSLYLPKSNKIRSEVIYNFVEVANKSNNNILKKKLGLNNDDVIFLYLARFAKSNGWEELIETAKKIVKIKTKYHFVFVGAENENQINYCKQLNIHILPFRHDVDDVLSSSDVFICPFVEPHFARGVIEASSHGLPIIGANIGGVNELILHGKTGFLYMNKKELENQINLLGEDKQLRIVLGKAGIMFAKDNFDMKTNLKRTYDFYNNILFNK